jgi:hypothetical protein
MSQISILKHITKENSVIFETLLDQLEEYSDNECIIGEEYSIENTIPEIREHIRQLHIQPAVGQVWRLSKKDILRTIIEVDEDTVSFVSVHGNNFGDYTKTRGQFAEEIREMELIHEP